MPRYDAKRIESKWQAFWEENKTFSTPDTPPENSAGKLYVLDMFPYPSGDGLHVGHPEGYTATDIVCRYARMQGKHVLHPMGWDAFGLPAEQYAIKTQTHPRIKTTENINTFRSQLKMLGFSYDWDRELATTDTEYFHWTQWIFLQIFNSWYDEDHEWTGQDGVARKGKARPIEDLPIPDDIQGEEAIRKYQDENRLAYQHEAPVNWCSELGTVLANEEIDSQGRSERGGHPVTRIPLRQWMLRITSYGDRLIDELDALSEWPESIKTMQKTWIGRSEGAEVDFFIGHATQEEENADFGRWIENRAMNGFPKKPGDDVLRVYTTRPDTLHGATYMVLSPEHPLVDTLTSAEQKEKVEKYRDLAALKSELDRTDLAKEKTGVYTGSYAVNPVNGEETPIWIADYVLISYGTGAIMAVPAHDLRDWEFAVTFDIPIVPVVETPDDYEPTREEKALETEIDGKMQFPFSGHGYAINSDEYSGVSTMECKMRITTDLEKAGFGKTAVNFRLRDWLFSRQHFWGEPFPVWHELDDDGNLTGLMRTDSEDSLPVDLPEDFEFKPHGRPEPPLDEAPDEWLYKTDTDGVRLKRETNSMPQWAGSCWYYIRYCDPKNNKQFIDPEKEKYWLPVDLYIGGAEHAVLHLLYARFWHKVLFDLGHVSQPEPFNRLVNQGMILGDAELTGYRKLVDDKPTGDWVSSSNVKDKVDSESGEAVGAVKLDESQISKEGSKLALGENSEITVESRAFKMSKSRGNVINPNDVVDQYGADSLRLYEMFMGPLEQTKPWNMSGVDGVSRFLGRAWRMIVDERSDDLKLHDSIQDVAPTAEQERTLHKTIKAVTEDIDKLSFNTAISRMMEFTNEIGSQDVRPISVMKPFVLLLSPFAPHLAEELWSLLGERETLAYHQWPAFDESKLVESEIEIPVQVNGKLRAKIKVPVDADQATMQSLAESDPQIVAFLEGKQVVKTIVVPKRMVNFVVKG